MVVELKVKRLDEKVELPTYATKGSAAVDIKAFFMGNGQVAEGYNPHNKELKMPIKQMPNGKIGTILQPDFRMKIPTGLIFDIPKNHYLELMIRSSISYKKGIVLSNSVPVIDSDYTEELFLLVTNTSDTPMIIYSGDRIAQAILKKKVSYKMVETKDEIEQKEDRIGGIGSTGT